MKNQNPLVSIIIPVYNMEAYLDNCLNSILEQTYLNWELILIDDGSKDKSKNICENWAKKDKRILFFSQDNHGVSYSRNRGIRESRGKYIIFIDADDIVFNQYIEVLINAFNKYNIDLSIISYFSFQDEKESQYYTLLNKDYEIISENIGSIFFSKTDGTICSKMFKKSIIDKFKLRFNESIYVSEDLLFNMQYSSYCNEVSFNTSKLYGYRQRAESAVHKVISEKWFTCLDVYSILVKNYEKSSFYPDIQYYYLKFLYEAKYNIKKNNLNISEIRPNIYNEIYEAERKAQSISFKRKVKLFICKYFFFCIVARRRI